MPAPETVLRLIDHFDRSIDALKSGHYKETQVRQEFIDPLFIALGWDVYNTAGNAEAYKDVILEDAVRVGGATKAPDYCFRVGGTRKFFLEAKKPSVNLKDDMSPAFQLRRYAWSAKLPLSILTDFEELAVYDCRVRPVRTDKASTARTIYLKYEEYEKRWDEIASIFSREAVLQGSFDKYVKSTKAKRGTAEVDSAFLAEIESWRDVLARNLALRNPTLTQRELNHAVQRTIDRIIFLRICEDRGIESYGRLQALLNGARLYPRLCELFRSADERYNSGLFHFRKERDREDPDEFTLGLAIDDKVLKDIIKRLYYPDSPYEFSVLPADILGQVYEQFLGKVIRLTAAHHAKVEDKPEVKKAGGVYYTPTYIVDYIVKNTVGKLVEGKTPKQVAQLRILDPACGSGSFLIGAYQYLLDWHRDNYLSAGARKHRKKLYEGSGGDWRLTTSEKKRILLNNIYGVDIDPQAVEVTKLSLLLKVLDEETSDTLESQLKLFHERALPDLGNNIKCGNSLIGPDFYDEQQMPLLDEDEKFRVNPLDWEIEFPKGAGFDAVIGNPPYGFHQIHSQYTKPYLKRHYQSSKGSFEHYFLFYERSLRLLRKSGFHGFIVPVTWLTIPSAHALRKFILDSYRLREIVWLPELVFANAQVNTAISIIQKSSRGSVNVSIYNSLYFREPPIEERTYEQEKFIRSDYYIGIFEKKADVAILKKIGLVSQPLLEVARPCSGYNPYEVGKGLAPEGGPHTKGTVASKPYHSDKKLNYEWKPEIVGRDLGRYSLCITGKRWIKYGPWLAAARDPSNFTGTRILVQEITGGRDRRIVASYHEGELYHSRDVIPIKIEGQLPDPLYLLAIINSWLATWYHHKRNPKAKKGLFPKVLVSDLKKLPVRKIDFDSPADKNHHDQIIKLAERMLSLHRKLAEENVPPAKTALNRQIRATDRQIDRSVCDLYGLTDQEIKLVEKSAPGQ